MAWESKHGDISLFPNDKKTKDNQPDWRGKITLDGKDYDIALWNKTSARSGTSFLSGRMGEESKPKTAPAWGQRKPNNAVDEAYGTPEKKTSVKEALDSDLPW